jgi:hypothetical protein
MFLAQERTAEELPKLWPPSILFEKPKSPEEKYKDPVEVAHEAIDWILENHRPAPLPEGDQGAQINRVKINRMSFIRV